MANDFVVEVNDSNFEETIKEGVVLIDFWATWCGPCRMQGPIIDQLAETYHGRATIGKLDTDQSQQTAISLGVASIPTLMLYKDGKLQQRYTGLQSKAQLQDAIDELL